MNIRSSAIDIDGPAERFTTRITDAPSNAFNCIDCKQPLGGEGAVFYGAGCGSGVEYRCKECHVAHEVALVLVGPREPLRGGAS